MSEVDTNRKASLVDKLLGRTPPGGVEIEDLLREKTDEGSQELEPRSRTSARELRLESGSVLRLPEGLQLDSGDIDVEVPEDESMILNLGPSHPSTHGVLRIMVEIDGETVLRSKPVVGYLHTGMEKTAEELMFTQGCTNVTRMDYLSPFFNELGFCLSVEKLLEIDIPPRAVWIRMLLCELNRISSHFLWLATNSADLGALNMLVYGWREREMVLAFFEKVTGLRMNHNYFRPGGVAADLPDGWRDDVLALCEAIPLRMDEYDDLLTGQPILQKRLQGVGPLDAETAIGLGLTGPLLRSTGVAWDLRRDNPYLAYDDVDFDVIVGTIGDCWDRYAIRFNEIRESVRILRQICDLLPEGDYRVQDKKVTPPPRSRIDESMEALIHHFKLYTEGFRVPPGEAYVPVESPRGESGCYIVSDGTARPYRVHMRSASFSNLQGMAPLARGALLADTIAIVSTIDPVLGDVDR
ncbi:MAG TPA: NADH dehydrogenase (quinone) subunit D [Acidimicrobiales bacterium]|jgi:NADH-quinone oxidoreductase subunit D|nr:NADH dehydrogenase (quinone) subunit D [Acidimicrobiales bacterium]